MVPEFPPKDVAETVFEQSTWTGSAKAFGAEGEGAARHAGQPENERRRAMDEICGFGENPAPSPICARCQTRVLTPELSRTAQWRGRRGSVSVPRWRATKLRRLERTVRPRAAALPRRMRHQRGVGSVQSSLLPEGKMLLDALNIGRGQHHHGQAHRFHH